MNRLVIILCLAAVVVGSVALGGVVYAEDQAPMTETGHADETARDGRLSAQTCQNFRGRTDDDILDRRGDEAKRSGHQQGRPPNGSPVTGCSHQSVAMA